MVKIVTVNRPLGPADSGDRPVQRVSVPVNYKTRDAQPKPVDVAVAQDETGGDHDGSDHSDNCQKIGTHPFRLPLSQPDKEFLLHPVEDGGLDPDCSFPFHG